MQSVTMRLTGVTPMLQHAATTANPMHPLSKRMKELTLSKKKKGADVDEILATMADVEFEAALYHDEKLGPYIPAGALKACIQEGAKLGRKGKEVVRAIAVQGAKIPLEYVGPRDMEGLRSNAAFRDQRIVSIQNNRILRTRPIFTDWACTVTILYNPEGISKENLISYIRDAGTFCGLMDGRSKDFGRFDIEVLGE